MGGCSLSMGTMVPCRVARGLTMGSVAWRRFIKTSTKVFCAIAHFDNAIQCF